MKDKEEYINGLVIFHKAAEFEYYDEGWETAQGGMPVEVQNLYPCRWDLEGGAKKLHFETIEKISMKLYISIMELRRHHNTRLPLCHKRRNNHRATWNYSVSYREPGQYLKVQNKLRRQHERRREARGKTSNDQSAVADRI